MHVQRTHQFWRSSMQISAHNTPCIISDFTTNTPIITLKVHSPTIVFISLHGCMRSCVCMKCWWSDLKNVLCVLQHSPSSHLLHHSPPLSTSLVLPLYTVSPLHMKATCITAPMEIWPREVLGEEICNLLLGGDKMQLHKPPHHLLP